MQLDEVPEGAQVENKSKKECLLTSSVSKWIHEIAFTLGLVWTANIPYKQKKTTCAAIHSQWILQILQHIIMITGGQQESCPWMETLPKFSLLFYKNACTQAKNLRSTSFIFLITYKHACDCANAKLIVIYLHNSNRSVWVDQAQAGYYLHIYHY